MSTAAVFTIDRTWKQPRGPSTDEWIKMGWYLCTMECPPQFSCSVVSDSFRHHESQHARPPCLSPTPGVYPNSCSSVSVAIQPSHPLSSPSPPAPNPFQHQGLFHWVNCSREVAKNFSQFPSSPVVLRRVAGRGIWKFLQKLRAADGHSSPSIAGREHDICFLSIF